jgi:hypothetical protein
MASKNPLLTRAQHPAKTEEHRLEASATLIFRTFSGPLQELPPRTRQGLPPRRTSLKTQRVRGNLPYFRFSLPSSWLSQLAQKLFFCEVEGTDPSADRVPGALTALKKSLYRVGIRNPGRDEPLVVLLFPGKTARG